MILKLLTLTRLMLITNIPLKIVVTNLTRQALSFLSWVLVSLRFLRVSGDFKINVALPHLWLAN